MIIIFLVLVLLCLCFTFTLVGVKIGTESNRVHKSTMNNVPPGNWFLRVTSRKATKGEVILTAMRRENGQRHEVRADLITLNLMDDDFSEKLEAAVHKADKNITELNSTIDVICQ